MVYFDVNAFCDEYKQCDVQTARNRFHIETVWYKSLIFDPSYLSLFVASPFQIWVWILDPFLLELTAIASGISLKTTTTKTNMNIDKGQRCDVI